MTNTAITGMKNFESHFRRKMNANGDNKNLIAVTIRLNIRGHCTFLCFSPQLSSDNGAKRKFLETKQITQIRFYKTSSSHYVSLGYVYTSALLITTLRKIVINEIVLLKRFSILEYRKTEATIILLANHKRLRKSVKPVKTPSK